VQIVKRDERSCRVLLCFALLALSANLWGDCRSGRAARRNKDYATALKEFTASASQGDSCSQFSLGVMYEGGQGVARDYKEAIRWYRLAADKGHAAAQVNLCGMYSSGRGAPQDYNEAIKWFRMAADQGDADAQNAVGGLYE
jgi:uncharacterized protein